MVGEGLLVSDIETDELPADTMPPEPKPPRKRDRTAEYAKRKTRGPGRPRKQNLTSQIEALLTTLALVWAIRDEDCAVVLNDQAHDIAAGLNAWAQHDPKVYRMLSRMLEGGGAGALAIALWPLGMQVAQHHVVPTIERRRQLLNEQREAMDWDGEPSEPLDVVGDHVPAEVFIPGNIVQEG